MEQKIEELFRGNINRMNKKAHRKINDKIYNLCKHPVDFIPIDKIKEYLAEYGYILLQEDNTEWCGMLLGREYRLTLEIADSYFFTENNGEKIYTPIKNTMLVLYWYKFDNGRYEINSYLS